MNIRDLELQELYTLNFIEEKTISNLKKHKETCSKNRTKRKRKNKK